VIKGPPQWLEDKHGYPLPDGDTHVSAVWYMSSDTEVIFFTSMYHSQKIVV
jgi:hypothetical protein